IGLDESGALVMGLAPIDGPFSRPSHPVAPGQVIEVSLGQAAFGEACARLVRAHGGAALLIDYGRDRPGPGDTLQALRDHEKVDPLAAPGEADVTMWADFPTVLDAAVRAGADV